MNPRRILPVTLAVLATACLAMPAAVFAQQMRVVEDDEWCDHDYGNRDREHFCEVREVTLSADRDLIDIDAAPNGGISVEGWDRNEILVRARVHTQAESESEARAIAQEIEIDLGRTIESKGPRTGRNEGWSVSFRVFVPRRSNLNLKSTNGGLSIDDVSGTIDFRTTNGGVRLTGLSGDVNGSTTNGSLTVELVGDEWQGAGMDVQTTNGGLKLMIPDDYNAEIESGTVNGGFRIDFPITVQGRIDRRIRATLGDGGKLIRARTTNGGVVITRA
jgi:hypothetical protein